MKSRPGQVPSGQPRYVRGGPLLPIRGGESQPGERPAAPASPPAPADPPASPPKPDEEPFDRDRAMRTIEALRTEVKDAKALKKQVDELTAKVSAHESEKLSESEKLAKKVTDLEAGIAARDSTLRTIRIRSEVERQARTLGIVDEDAAYRLLDLDALTFDEDGKPTNAEKLLKALLEAKPYLKAPEQGTRPGVPATPRPNGQTPDQKVDETRRILAQTGNYSRF